MQRTKPVGLGLSQRQRAKRYHRAHQYFSHYAVKSSFEENLASNKNFGNVLHLRHPFSQKNQDADDADTRPAKPDR
ncbi:MAG: hypothetical protein ACLFT6_06950 [Bacteroidales bacterium]